MSEETKRIEEFFYKIGLSVEKKLRKSIDGEQGKLAFEIEEEAKEQLMLEGMSFDKAFNAAWKLRQAAWKDSECRQQATMIVFTRDLKNVVCEAVRRAGGTKEEAEVVYKQYYQRPRVNNRRPHF